jgi:four helix bundle protein
MNENIVKDKSFSFAIRIVKLYKYLKTDLNEYVLSKQLLRSGTAVGALIRESEHAESKTDFIHKLAIAQKEINETIYWLDLLHATDYLSAKEYQSIQHEAIELLKLLTSILKTSKSNLKNPRPSLTINH